MIKSLNSQGVPDSPSFRMLLEICYSGISLVIQWLRLHASTAGSWIQFLVGELRSQMLCCMAKKKKKEEEEEEEKKYIVI